MDCRQCRGADGAADAAKAIESVEGAERDATEAHAAASKQAEEARYLALLARAEKIEDILRIDQTLNAVRTQIEQLTGQLNSMKNRTTFSTISLSITPTGVLPVGDPKVYDPSKTVERAIAALGVMLRVASDLAIWLLVFAWIPLLLLGGAVAAQRARRQPAASGSSPAAPGAS